MITAAAVCPSPPLLAAEVTGQADVLPELRRACASAVGRLLDGDPDRVVIVGAGPATADWDPGDRLDLSAYAPGVAGRSDPSPGGPTPALAGARPDLPLAVGLGAMLLDAAGYQGPLELRAVAETASPQECARLGAELAGARSRTALLAVGDGTARRTLKAPGRFDERAEPFDDIVARAFADGDLAALAGLDPVLAQELMATGRAAWQVLAGALGSGALGSGAPGSGAPGNGAPGNGAPESGGPGNGVPAEILYSDGPYGVFYLVAVLAVRAV
ncbi:MAG TPA: hypothetical protein VGG75_37070 [Trebonia sp.]|jgi:hypothetical protein